MPFDINPSGTITITPLVSYETAVIADEACGLRLVLATPEDQPGTGSIAVQTAMTDAQAEELARDLQRIVEHIRLVRRGSTAH